VPSKENSMRASSFLALGVVAVALAFVDPPRVLAYG
jgi:hypothetical protein